MAPPIASIATVREIDVRVQFQWDGTNWTDETQNLLSVSGALETTPLNETYFAGKQTMQQATIMLANRERRYSVKNTSGPLYTYLQGNKVYRKKCKIEVWDNSAWQMVFLGYVKRVPSEDPITSRVTFSIWDVGEVARARRSTPMLRDLPEHEVVAHYLELTGLVDGTDFVSQAYAATNSVPATIDFSTVLLPHSWLDDEPVWDELVDIASASGSRIYASPEGVVYFEKGWRWSTPAVGETITKAMYTGYSEQIDDKGFFDKVTVGFAPRVPGASQELWSLSDNRIIQPGETEEIEARLRYAAISVEPPTGYYLRTLSGADATSSCTVGPITYNAQLVTISITNNSSQAVLLGNLKLTGQPLVGQPSEQVKATVSEIEYNRPMEVRDNPYMQSKAQADTVKEFLKWWYSSLKTVYQLQKMRGVPTRRLMQRVTIETLYGNVDAIITRIAWNIQVTKNSISYTQDISAIENVFQNDSYFVVGVDTLGTAKMLWA